MKLNFKLTDALGAVNLEQQGEGLMEIEGFFTESSVVDGPMFLIRMERGVEFLEVRNVPPGFEKVFAWMGKDRTDVHLSGKWEPPVFHVVEMEFDEAQTETMVHIILKKIGLLSTETAIPGEDYFFFDDGDKVRAYLFMAGETLPKGLREWAESLLRVRGASDTEQCHIRRALADCLSIDWSIEISPPTIHEAKTALDEGLFGLEEVKAQLLELIAEVLHHGKFPKFGVLLVGAPGTAKTMLCQIVAELFQVPIFRMDMPLIHSAEDLIGSRRLYQNAMHGKVVSELIKARRGTGIFFIDELDKPSLGGDRGDPRNVILTMMDGAFKDQFWGELTVPIHALFLATANATEGIPEALLNRFHLLELPAYTRAEKKQIFTRFALPRVQEAMAIKQHAFRLDDEGIDYLINSVALEPGARDVEKIAQKLSRKYLLRSMERGEKEIVYAEEDLREMFPSNKQTWHFPAVPGLVRVLYVDQNKQTRMAAIQVKVFSGEGKITCLGGLSEQQRDDLRTAWYAVQGVLGGPVHKLDVVLRVLPPPLDTGRNTLGLAAFAAICSAIREETLPDTAAFAGGVDLDGNIYDNEYDLTGVMAQLEENIHFLYGPVLEMQPVFSKVHVFTAQKADELYQYIIGT